VATANTWFSPKLQYKNFRAGAGHLVISPALSGYITNQGEEKLSLFARNPYILARLSMLGMVGVMARLLLRVGTAKTIFFLLKAII